MKVIACIFAILSGIIGLFGATAQGFLGFGISSFTHSDGLMSSGIILFYLSWLIIILGGISLKFPKSCGVGLLIISVIAFLLGNIFSAPFAFIAGIFGLLAQSTDKSNEFMTSIERSGSTVLDNSSSIKRGDNDPNSYSNDNSTLLDQLSQLYTLKEKNVITEEIYEQERLTILSKFQHRSIEQSEKSILQEEKKPDVITEKYVSQQGDYDPAYEELFKENWLQKSRILVIVAAVIILSSLFFIEHYYHFLNGTNIAMSNSDKNDWKELNLKGGIKSLSVTKNALAKNDIFDLPINLVGLSEKDSNIVFNENGEEISKNGRDVINSHDSDGNRTERIDTSDLDNRFLDKYDNKGHLVLEHMSDNGNGQPANITYKYDDVGNRIESVFRYNFGYSTTIYKYDSEGNVIEDQMRSFGINEYSGPEIFYKYDDKGNVIKASYSKDGSKMEVTCQYTYDNQNNWIKRIVYINAKPVDVFKRELAYYN